MQAPVLRGNQKLGLFGLELCIIYVGLARLLGGSFFSLVSFFGRFRWCRVPICLCLVSLCLPALRRGCVFSCGGQVMDGVMFNKDVTHSKMRRKIENPRVLLLDCPLEYKKGEVCVVLRVLGVLARGLLCSACASDSMLPLRFVFFRGAGFWCLTLDTWRAIKAMSTMGCSWVIWVLRSSNTFTVSLYPQQTTFKPPPTNNSSNNNKTPQPDPYPQQRYVNS